MLYSFPLIFLILQFRYKLQLLGDIFILVQEVFDIFCGSGPSAHNTPTVMSLSFCELIILRAASFCFGNKQASICDWITTISIESLWKNSLSLFCKWQKFVIVSSCVDSTRGELPESLNEIFSKCALKPDDDLYIDNLAIIVDVFRVFVAVSRDESASAVERNRGIASNNNIFSVRFSSNRVGWKDPCLSENQIETETCAENTPVEQGAV
jgi:hypothetical protein